MGHQRVVAERPPGSSHQGPVRVTGRSCTGVVSPERFLPLPHLLSARARRGPNQGEHMRRMLERISPVLLVSVAVGGFVVMSSLPATAESPTERLDRLHAGRPVAAYGSNHLSVDRRLIQENARLLAEAIAAGETPPVFSPPPVIEEDPPAPPANWRP